MCEQSHLECFRVMWIIVEKHGHGPKPLSDQICISFKWILGVFTVAFLVAWLNNLDIQGRV